MIKNDDILWNLVDNPIVQDFINTHIGMENVYIRKSNYGIITLEFIMKSWYITINVFSDCSVEVSGFNTKTIGDDKTVFVKPFNTLDKTVYEDLMKTIGKPCDSGAL